MSCRFGMGLSTIAIAAALASALATYAPPRAEAESPNVEELNIVFARVDGVDLKLDLDRPSKGNEPFPVLMYIHGGGWYSGGKIACRNLLRTAARNGYAAVSVDYRLTGFPGNVEYSFPAQVYDVKCAVRWLRANAVKYNLDPQKIAAVGFSSGGHLALLLALTDKADGLEGEGPYEEYSSRVQAAVSSAGPIDLASLIQTTGSPYIEPFVGGTLRDVPYLYRRASPLTYASTAAPPILLIHGDRDTQVPLEQAKLLDRRLTELGVAHSVVIKKGYDHSALYDEREVWDFLSGVLKK